MTNLLPCPFCNGSAHLADTGVHWVICNDCSTEGPVADTEQDAIARWNTRSAIPASAQSAVQPFDVMDTIDPDYAASFEREKCQLCGSSNGHSLSCVKIQRDHIDAEPAQRERPAFLNSLKKTAKVMRSAHDKGGDRLMSIWTEDVQGVEEAIEFLESSCGAESNRHRGAVGAEKRAEQSNPGGGHEVTRNNTHENTERGPTTDEPTPGSAALPEGDRP